MPIPLKDDVRSILEDFHVRLRRVVDDAWKEWVEFPGKGKFVFLPRVRAVLSFEDIVALIDDAAPKPGRPKTYKKRVA